MPRYLTGFRDEHASLWGRHPVRIEHGLADTGLFGDDALAELLQAYPRDNYDLLHMAEQGTGNLAHWTEGDLGSARGREALDAITSGRLWINLRRVHEVSPAHARLLDAMFEELAELVPGFHPYKLNLGILISSPGAQVYYHADVPGQSLWHLRGKKRVFVYPNRAPFLPEEQIEKVVLSLTEAEIDYEPWFDEYATVFDLEPGQMLNWPLNAPHRVENGDTINVSVTTEHFTTHIRNKYAVRYANGLLRRGLRIPPPAPVTRGPSFWSRAALTAAVKTSGLLKSRQLQKTIEWELDPSSPSRMRSVEPFVV